MKKQYSINNTFKVLRELPLELSFSQIEQWLEQHSIPPPNKESAWPNWLKTLITSISKN